MIVKEELCDEFKELIDKYDLDVNEMNRRIEQFHPIIDDVLDSYEAKEIIVTIEDYNNPGIEDIDLVFFMTKQGLVSTYERVINEPENADEAFNKIIRSDNDIYMNITGLAFETLFEMNIIESTEDGYKLNIEKE